MSPMYEYFCPNCNVIYEVFNSVKERKDSLVCRDCFGKARQFFSSPPTILGSTSRHNRRRFPYHDESLDVTFNTYEQKQAYLKKNNIRILDKGEKLYKSKEKVSDPNVVMSTDDDVIEKKIHELSQKQKKRRNKAKRR